MSASDAVARLLAEAIARRVIPGAVVEAGTSMAAAWTVTAGAHTYAPDAAPVTTSTLYDLASLTKVIATTTLAMEAHASGRLPLDACLAERLPSLHGYGAVTVRDLLEHAAGFPAHRLYYQQVAGAPAYLSRIAVEPPSARPRERSEYSDLGFIVLGHLLEGASGAPLDRQFASFSRDVLDTGDLSFCPAPSSRSRIAPTAVSPWRGRVIHGHVHDDNAAALGGVAGHAGLFGTAPAIGAFARWMLGLLRGSTDAWRSVDTLVVEAFVTPSTVPGSSRALGWDTMRPTSSCGTRLSARAVGHTGFTGTSLWIDPARDLYVVALTNRVHPVVGGDAIQPLRMALHDTIADGWPARA